MLLKRTGAQVNRAVALIESRQLEMMVAQSGMQSRIFWNEFGQMNVPFKYLVGRKVMAILEFTLYAENESRNHAGCHFTCCSERICVCN